MENEESQEIEFRESFGDFLRRHREASGKTLDAVARTTRIPKRYLQAFEESDSARFPEETFTRGFLRSYALEIGIEVDDTMTRYERFQRSLMPTQIKEIRPSRSQSSFADLGVAANIPWKVPAAILGGLIVVVGLTLFVVQQRSRPSSRVSMPETKTEEAAQPVEPKEVAAPAAVAPSAPLATPVAPSSLTIKALKKGVVSIRLDDHPVQEVALEADETKSFNVFREVELKGPDRKTFEFLYNGKPLEVSGPSVKLFNRNLFTSSAKP